MRILFLSLFAVTLFAADQVVLTNGDTITGTVIKKDGAKLTFKSEFLGEVAIPWTAIKTLKSDQELVVVLPGGESVKGKVSTEGSNLAVAAAGGEKTAPLATVSAVRNDAEQVAWEKVQHPGIFQQWDGTYNLGFALARGNAHTANLTNSFAAVRSTPKDKITINFNELYATATINPPAGTGVSAATASQLNASWAYNRNLTPKFFLASMNEYDHDRFQDLDLRMVFGGGAGWNAVKTDKVQFALQGGGDYEREAFSNNFDRSSGEANISDNLVFKVSNATSLTQAFQFFPNLTDTGEYRFNFNLSAVTALKKWLGWHVSFSDNYLSNPILGRLRNDVILSTGFQLKFNTK